MTPVPYFNIIYNNMLNVNSKGHQLCNAMRLPDSQLLRYGLPRAPKRHKATSKRAVQLKLAQLSSKEDMQSSAALPYLDPSALKRNRVDLSFVLSSSNWDAHEGPVYGYTCTSFTTSLRCSKYGMLLSTATKN